MRQLLTEWERAKQKRIIRQQTVTHQTVQTASQQPRKHRFSMPHLNGDVSKQYQCPVYTIRQHMQYIPNSQNQYTLSNSVVMYDQVRGQYYTELAWSMAICWLCFFFKWSLFHLRNLLLLTPLSPWLCTYHIPTCLSIVGMKSFCSVNVYL